MIRNKTIAVSAQLILWLVALGLAGCSQSYTFHGTQYDPPQPAPLLAGANWDGAAFQLAEQQGKVVVIFFGYSHCPDVCPLTLANLAQVYTQLREKAAGLAVVFVSTDPERDTTTRLAEYIPAFQQAFYGIHIPADQLASVKKAFGVFAEAASPAGEATQGYTVSHSEYLFVIDKSGNLRVLLPADLPQEALLADLEYLLKS